MPIRPRPGPCKGQTHRLCGWFPRAEDGPESEMEEICGAPGQVVIRRRDGQAVPFGFARAAPWLSGSCGRPGTAGAGRWCEFWQPGLV